MVHETQPIKFVIHTFNIIYSRCSIHLSQHSQGPKAQHPVLESSFFFQTSSFFFQTSQFIPVDRIPLVFMIMLNLHGSNSKKILDSSAFKGHIFVIGRIKELLLSSLSKITEQTLPSDSRSSSLTEYSFQSILAHFSFSRTFSPMTGSLGNRQRFSFCSFKYLSVILCILYDWLRVSYPTPLLPRCTFYLPLH